MKFLILSCGFFMAMFVGVEGSASLRAVTTFSVLENLVQEIGGAKVTVSNLVPAGEDPHLFEPRPQDLEKMRKARVVFANGLGLEPWLPRLTKASNSSSKIQIVTSRTKVRKNFLQGHADDLDPHAWNSPTELLNYIDLIAERLSEESPKDVAEFKKNASRLKTEIQVIKDRYQKIFSKIPRDQRVILMTHDAGFYLCDEFGITSISPVGLSTSEEFKTGDLSQLLDNIKKYKIKTIFSDRSHHQMLSQKLASKAKLKMGGVLYLDGLSSPKEPASSVLKMLVHNLETIKNVLEESVN